MNAVNLYWRYIGISIRAQMQYRLSFVMLALSSFLITALEAAGVWVLFHRFGTLGGWSLAEVAMFYGIINTAYALAEGVGRGFDVFSRLIRAGDFDRLLLRPRSAAFQVAAQELRLMRVGRLAQGLAVLLWAAASLNLHWTAGRVGVAVLAVLGGACLFYGIFILQATMCFWTIDSLELAAVLTNGGVETGQYPITVYHPWFCKFFTFIVPLASVTYFPVLAILGRADTAAGSPYWFQCLSPIIGVFFLLASLRVWCAGVRHYRSTGS